MNISNSPTRLSVVKLTKKSHSVIYGDGGSIRFKYRQTVKCVADFHEMLKNKRWNIFGMLHILCNNFFNIFFHHLLSDGARARIIQFFHGVGEHTAHNYADKNIQSKNSPETYQFWFRGNGMFSPKKSTGIVCSSEFRVSDDDSSNYP